MTARQGRRRNFLRGESPGVTHTLIARSVEEWLNGGARSPMDAAGNYDSDQPHVVERDTRTSRDTLLCEATVEDPELGRLLDQIEATNPNDHPREFWAASMMKWFSQTVTEGENLHADLLERHPTARPYRYRLKRQ
jgi:hypothetical protein